MERVDGVEEYEIDVYFDHSYQGSIDSYVCSGSVCYAYSTPHYEQYTLLTGTANNCTSSGDVPDLSILRVVLYVLLITSITSLLCYCIFRFFIVRKLAASHDGHDPHQPTVVEEDAGPHGSRERAMWVRQHGQGQQYGGPMMAHPGAGRPQFVEVQAVPVKSGAPVFVDNSNIELVNVQHGGYLQQQPYTEHYQQPPPSYGQVMQPDELEAVDEASMSVARANQVSPGTHHS